MNEQRVYTIAEIEAYHLLRDASRIPLTNEPRPDFHDAGNIIIKLAEKIKAERMVVAMEKQDDQTTG